MAKGTYLRLLHLGHRWLGIGLCLMVLLWFISGLVMLFVARPQLDDAERLAGLPPLAADSVRVSPATAWQALGLSGAPQAIRLTAAGGTPAYRFLAEKRWWQVDARDGRIVPEADALLASRLVLPHAGPTGIATVSTLTQDQWTLYRRFDALRPFWLVQLRDGRAYYVSARTGEVALDTAPGERAWNWLGSVVHWLYITPLRANTPLWRNVVLWGSGAALLLAFSGLWLGLQRLRLRRRYRNERCTPYRHGWKRWHHLLGLSGGLILLTWLFSGWLSMAPFGLGSAPQKPGRAATLAMSGLTDVPAPTPESREIEWLMLGKTLLRVDRQIEDSRIQQINVGLPPGAQPALSLAQITDALGVPLASASWLASPDSRHYPLRHHPRSFPAARVELGDAAGSVLYIAPRSGRIETVSNQDDQAYRWLNHGLHRFDLPGLVDRPMLRDALIILLSLLGIGLSLSGCILGWHRLSNTRRETLTAAGKR